MTARPIGLLLVVLGALGVAPVGAAPSRATPDGPARPFTLEDVVAFRTIEDLRVSPDGRLAVFTASTARIEEGRYETDIFLVGIEGAVGERRLTFTPGTDVMPRWSPDGGSIAFLSERGGAKQVWVLPRDGGEARQVTTHPQPVASFDWAPDGQRLLIVAPTGESDEETRRKKNRDDAFVLGSTWRNRRIWLVRLPEEGRAEGGPGVAALERPGGHPGPEDPVPLTDGSANVQRAAWSPDGRRIAWLESPTPEADADEEARVRVLDVERRTIRDVPSSLRATLFEWSPDGRSLAFAAPFDGRGFSRQDLFVWEVIAAGAENGERGPREGKNADAPAPRNLSSALDRDVEEFLWSADGREVEILFSRGVASAIARVSVGDARIREKPLIRDVRTPDQVVEHLRRAGDRSVYVRCDRPHEVWVASEDNPARPLTRINAAADAIDLPVTEPIRWDGPEGPLEGVLVRPRVLVAERRYPLILRPHGGPRLQSTLAFDPQALYLAARGYLILRPNFRGSTGYGDAFTKSNVADWGHGPFADVMSGADALVARGLADPQRLFLYGWSYGGYLANWAATHTNRLRAIASGAGVADLRMQYVLSDARRWRFDYLAGGPFEGKLDVYERLSPITYAGTAGVPTLFIHGERDERCPLAQGVMMHRALSDRGVPTELVLYPREGHDFAEPRHLLDRIRRVAEWFEKHDLAGDEGGAR